MKDNLSNEKLAEIVKVSISFCDAARKAGKKPRGATLQWFTKRIRKLGLDTSHFLGKAAHSGSRHTGSCRKKTWQEVLHSNYKGRADSEILHRAFKEYCAENSIKYCCSICGILPIWNGKILKLEIDHINEVNTDNNQNNLRWVCPNCHSQHHSMAVVQVNKILS